MFLLPRLLGRADISYQVRYRTWRHRSEVCVAALFVCAAVDAIVRDLLFAEFIAMNDRKSPSAGHDNERGRGLPRFP